jgi:hypothetical protein
MSLAAEIKRKIGVLPPRLTIASAPLVSDVKAPRSLALSSLLLDLVAAALGRASSGQATFQQTRTAARQAGHAAVLWLKPRVHSGRIGLTVEIYAIGQTVWSRAARPEPVLRRQFFVEARLDAQLRQFLVPLRIGEPRVTKFSGADHGIVALACGDLDADGLSEVVSMTRRRLLVAELARGQVIRQHQVRWADLSGIAAVPFREPLGLLELVPRSEAAGMWIDATLSDRAKAVRLDASLDVERTTQRRLPVASDATASRRIVTRDGATVRWSLSREMRRRTKVRLRLRGGDENHSLGRGGAQLAVGDVDQDGRPDVISSRDVRTARRDAIDVISVKASGLVTPRFSLDVPGGVEAVAICPVDDGGLAPIVVASRGEIWLIR